ncbi:MAG TPA: hypothetical protein VH988_25300 [Thermoanaerobaculia bacterium]|nr:hypothetical protein [Thermoanaerobaculia bacterium]
MGTEENVSDVQIAWKFGDGKTSTEHDPSHAATDTATGCSATARLNVGACRR